MSEKEIKPEVVAKEPAAKVEIEPTILDAVAEAVEQPSAAPGSTVKPEEPSDSPIQVVNDVIGSVEPKRVSKPKPSVASVNNTIGSSTSKDSDTPTHKVEDVAEKVAIYSTKNVSWAGVGKLHRGYNIVLKGAALKWLDKPFARLATPEEVARELSN